MLLCVAQSVSAHTPSTWVPVLVMLILMTKKGSLQDIFPNSACSKQSQDSPPCSERLRAPNGSKDFLTRQFIYQDLHHWIGRMYARPDISISILIKTSMDKKCMIFGMDQFCRTSLVPMANPLCAILEMRVDLFLVLTLIDSMLMVPQTVGKNSA